MPHYDDKLQQLQQQLKAEQKVKTNMARELDMLKTQQGRQKMDVAVQFTPLQTISGTVILYHCNKLYVAYNTLLLDDLHEVTVVAEDVFTINGDRPQVFHWEKYGFKMSVPQGSLEANETCDVAFKAIAHGQFEFPENTQLVSGVYAIYMPHKLLQPATIEVEHCVRLETVEQSNCLGFVRAYCTQKDLPYTFKSLKGGRFSADSSVGKINLSRFSQVAITQEVPATNEKTPSRDDHVYLAHVYFCLTSSRPPKWTIIFLVTTRLNLIVEVIIFD